ncbi:MAG: DeoR/GlpR family DNA-binding transcription regulator [Cetobacterium sp.]|uniref:DeoR/GlpR family DNA-binding transcription regulator n=1 Tax=Cetobacterium sp. TaxID=2071632 RepID=UPI003F339362
MFVAERKEKILEILHKKERVSVNELSEYFNLSKVIIRKYLGQLEEEGVVERTHGGAILKRKVINRVFLMDLAKEDYEDKEVIAKKAVSLIEDGDMIVLDGSTITLIMAELLRNCEIKITVITNMLSVYNILGENSNIHLISLGGYFDPVTNSFVGEIPKANLQNFNPNKVFVGVAGINLHKLQMSTCTIEEGAYKRAILDSSDKKYILVQNKKFHQDSLYNFHPIDHTITFISDDKISKEKKNILEENSVEYI